mmetsp:Transcript_26148/g.68640  ORF Transcript_26148/g.68640 Transcript_26148/m.68640 type:complete len:204 (-) Transcript_26148:1897-2508(-)
MPLEGSMETGGAAAWYKSLESAAPCDDDGAGRCGGGGRFGGIAMYDSFATALPRLDTESTGLTTSALLVGKAGAWGSRRRLYKTKPSRARSARSSSTPMTAPAVAPLLSCSPAPADCGSLLTVTVSVMMTTGSPGAGELQNDPERRGAARITSVTVELWMSVKASAMVTMPVGDTEKCAVSPDVATKLYSLPNVVTWLVRFAT